MSPSRGVQSSLSRFNRYLLSFLAISRINCVFIRVYRYTDGVALTRSSYTWEIRMARDYWFFFSRISRGSCEMIARPKKRRFQVEIGNSQRRTCLLLTKSLTSAHRLKRKLRSTCFLPRGTCRKLQIPFYLSLISDWLAKLLIITAPVLNQSVSLTVGNNKINRVFTIQCL